MLQSMESEHHGRTNREIVFDEFQYVHYTSTSRTDRQMDVQTDGVASLNFNVFRLLTIITLHSESM